MENGHICNSPSGIPRFILFQSVTSTTIVQIPTSKTWTVHIQVRLFLDFQSISIRTPGSVSITPDPSFNSKINIYQTREFSDFVNVAILSVWLSFNVICHFDDTFFVDIFLLTCIKIRMHRHQTAASTEKSKMTSKMN